MIKLKCDSLDLDYYRKFGSADFLPTNLSFDRPEKDYTQEPGDVHCTCITTVECAFDENGTVYDFLELFNRIPNTPSGANPRDALGEATKNGLKRKDNGQYEKKFSSYWRADTNPDYDAFDSVRSTMKIAEVPVACASPFYVEWNGQMILPVGERIGSYHMYEIEAVTEKDGEIFLVADMWQGRKVYLSRACFNKAMSVMGAGAWVLSTSVIDAIRKKTLMESLIDAMKNLVLLLQTQLAFLK